MGGPLPGGSASICVTYTVGFACLGDVGRDPHIR